MLSPAQADTPIPLDIPPSMMHHTGFLVNTLGHRLRAATESCLSDRRLRARQVGLLMVLRDEGAMQQQVLGERLAMDRTTTMRLVSELETLGLVVRDQNPDDKRAYEVRLSPRGVRAATQAEQEVRHAQAQVLAPLTSAEAKTFHKLLLKLLVARPES